MAHLRYTIDDLQRYRAEGCKGLPQFSDLGGYTIAYYDLGEHDYGRGEGDFLCAKCATKFLEESDPESDVKPRTVACETYDEGPAQYCVNCNAEIASSYGDPDAPED